MAALAHKLGEKLAKQTRHGAMDKQETPRSSLYSLGMTAELLWLATRQRWNWSLRRSSDTAQVLRREVNLGAEANLEAEVAAHQVVVVVVVVAAAVIVRAAAAVLYSKVPLRMTDHRNRMKPF